MNRLSDSSGTLERSLRPIDLSPTVRETVTAFEPQVRKEGGRVDRR